jgi:hypothetical protein
VVLGSFLGLLAFVILYFHVVNYEPDATLEQMFSAVFYPALLFLFSLIIGKTGHYFYSEILFSSHLVHFFADGTYSESRISTGMALYDSNRSENTVLRTAATPWLLVSKVYSSTFADSTTDNLEGPRHVLEMYKDGAFMADLVNGIKHYLDHQEVLAGVDSQKDLENTDKYFRINEATRAEVKRKKNELRESDRESQRDLDAPRDE